MPRRFCSTTTANLFPAAAARAATFSRLLTLRCGCAIWIAALTLSANASAQAASDTADPGSVGAAVRDAPSSQQPSSPPIQDNSFLLEEAYNQEASVIQHISFFTHYWGKDSSAYTFTQEWPFPRRARHQLSYTVPVMSSGAGGGIGDLALNYRYQLLGGGDSRLAFAPRLSLLAPTGNSQLGRGFGGTAVQTNLPVSVAVNKHWVMHFNAGATVAPNAKNTSGKAFVAGYNLGQSVIWVASPRFNLLLETMWNSSAEVIAPGKTQPARDLLLTPGFRWAHNFRNGLQIVPGLGFSVGVGPSRGTKGLALYLSFEHPIGHTQSLDAQSTP